MKQDVGCVIGIFTVGWPSHMTQTSVVTSESLMSLMIGHFIISQNISVEIYHWMRLIFTIYCA